MKKNTQAESLVGIIIGIMILSVVLLGLGNLLSYSNFVIDSYASTDRSFIIRSNLGNIVRRIDTTQIQQGEVFYVYKDYVASEFKIFTGAVNIDYKYIDKHGTKIDDINTYEGDIYARMLWIERDDESMQTQNQVLRASVKRLIK